jgi:two-component system, response regulator YesN
MTSRDPIKILIVDDDPAIRELYSRGLPVVIPDRTINVSTAPCGQTGLARILGLQPSIVVTDQNMPNLYGTQMIELAREQGYHGPVVMVTGELDLPVENYPVLRKGGLRELGSAVSRELDRHSL